MSLKKTLEEYKDIAIQNPMTAKDIINEKITIEEASYSKSEVKRFIKMIKKETKVNVDDAILWNELRDD